MTLGLAHKELDDIFSILKKFPDVSEAVLFGSRAIGTFKTGSDVDIALKGRLTTTDVARIKATLEEETPLPYTFDVVNYETIETPAFKEHIDKHGRSIYKRDV